MNISDFVCSRFLIFNSFNKKGSQRFTIIIAIIILFRTINKVRAVVNLIGGIDFFFFSFLMKKKKCSIFRRQENKLRGRKQQEQ